MNKQLVFRRKAIVKGGHVYIGIYINGRSISFSGDGVLCPSMGYTRSALQAAFPELKASEVVACFGRLPIVEGGEIATNEFGVGVIVIPAKRKLVKRQTKLIEEWVRNGMNACLRLIQENGVDGWLWEEAIAEAPDFKFSKR